MDLSKTLTEQQDQERGQQSQREIRRQPWDSRQGETTSDIPSLPLGALQDAMTRTAEKKEVKEQGRNLNGKVPGNKQGMQSYILTQIRQRGPYASHFGLETENVQIIICIHRLCMVVPSIVIQQEYFFCFQFELVMAQPCWLAIYQWRAEKG